MLFRTTAKIGITSVLFIATLVVAVASSAYSGSIKQVFDPFSIGNEVATLGLSLYVIGFALGPLVWAPTRKLVGQQWPFVFSLGALRAFLAGYADVQNI